MLRNDEPLVAEYRHKTGDALYRRIVAWSEDGSPLVADKVGLVLASELLMSGYRYLGVTRADEVDAFGEIATLQIIPAYGIQLEDGRPVVALALKAGGVVVPMVAVEGSYIEEFFDGDLDAKSLFEHLPHKIE